MAQPMDSLQHTVKGEQTEVWRGTSNRGQLKKRGLQKLRENLMKRDHFKNTHTHTHTHLSEHTDQYTQSAEPRVRTPGGNQPRNHRHTGPSPHNCHDLMKIAVSFLWKRHNLHS